MTEQEEFEFRLRYEREQAAKAPPPAVAPQVMEPQQQAPSGNMLSRGLQSLADPVNRYAQTRQVARKAQAAAPKTDILDASIRRGMGLPEQIPARQPAFAKEDIPDAALRVPAAILGGGLQFGADLAEKPMRTIGGLAESLATSPRRTIEAFASTGPAAAAGDLKGVGKGLGDALMAGTEFASIVAPPLRGAAAAPAKAATKAAGKAPSVDDLKRIASDYYDAAEARGVTAGPNTTSRLAGEMKALASKEGAVLPDGAVVDVMPKVRSSLNMIEQFAGQKMTPTQMKAVRKSFQNAAGSQDGSEARLGSMLLNKFDDFADGMAPEFREARKYWHRAKKGEKLEQLRELAHANEQQLTQSGFENALRKEYRNLDRRIVRGQEKGFTPEEVKAIQKVARGTPISNAARAAGRFAPKGPVSFTGAVGVPTAVGSALGSPAAGLVLGATVAGLGYGGRALATKLGIQAANTAELLVKTGMKPGRVKAMSTGEREAYAAVIAAQLADEDASLSEP